MALHDIIISGQHVTTNTADLSFHAWCFTYYIFTVFVTRWTDC